MTWDTCTEAVLNGSATPRQALNHERAIKKLQGRLKQLDAKRAEVQAKLTALMREHIEAQRIEDAAGSVGDAGMVSRWSKQRLLDMIEEHWRVHHMFAVEHYKEQTREWLVNYFLDIKGLTGSFVKPKPRRQATDRKKLSSIVW